MIGATSEIRDETCSARITSERLVIDSVMISILTVKKLKVEKRKKAACQAILACSGFRAGSSSVFM